MTCACDTPLENYLDLTIALGQKQENMNYANMSIDFTCHNYKRSSSCGDWHIANYTRREMAEGHSFLMV